MRARVIVVVLAIFLGFGAALSVVKYMDSVRNEAIDRKALVAALTAVAPLPRGLSLDELRSRGLIVAKKVPKEFVPEGMLSPQAELKGQVLAADVVMGEVLTASRFAPPEQAGLSFTTPEGMVAVSIPVEAARAVGNHVNVGDYVNVIVTYSHMDPKLGQEKKTETMLRRVEVLAIADLLRRPVPEKEEDRRDKEEKTGSDKNRTVTLSVPPEDSVSLIEALEKEGKAWLTLVPSPDAPVASQSDIVQSADTPPGLTKGVE